MEISKAMSIIKEACRAQATNIHNLAFESIQKALGDGQNKADNNASPKLPDKILDFMCYLVDNCEGEVVSEERLLVIGSDYIRSQAKSGE